MISYTVVNYRDNKLFLGRGGIRDFPLLFKLPIHAHKFKEVNAQVPSDWRVAEVSCQISVDAVEFDPSWETISVPEDIGNQ